MSKKLFGHSLYTRPSFTDIEQLFQDQEGTVNISKRINSSIKNDTNIRIFYLHHSAAESLKAAILYARKKYGDVFLIDGGYRDVRRQRRMFLSKLQKTKNFLKTIRHIAPPGRSEHHTGLAIDIAKNLPIASVCLPLFGWQLPFPEHSRSDFRYEPWHWRYVGRPAIIECLNDSTLTSSEKTVAKENLGRFATHDFTDIFKSSSNKCGTLEHFEVLRASLIALNIIQRHVKHSNSSIVNIARRYVAEKYAPFRLISALRTVIETENILALGDTGGRVQSLQRLLQKFGFYSQKIISTFSSETESALKRFQYVAGLWSSGITDGETLFALQKTQINILDYVDTDFMAEVTEGQWTGSNPSRHMDGISIGASQSSASELIPLFPHTQPSEILRDRKRHYHLLTDTKTNVDFPHVSYLRVQRAVRGLTRLARYARNHLQGKVIAITGSSGKTTTKSLLVAALSSQGLSYSSPGSANNTAAVSASLINASLNADYLIFESGLGADGSPIKLHSDLLQPDIAIITSIHAAHTSGYSSVDEIALKKLDIASNLHPEGFLIVDADSPFFPLCLAKAEEYGVKNIFSFGRSVAAHARLIHHEFFMDGTYLEIDIKGKKYSTKIPLAGTHWGVMVAATAATCSALEINIKDALLNLENMLTPPGRGKILKKNLLSGGELYIYDSHYNANPGSMPADLKTYCELSKSNKKMRNIAIIGEYKELGEITNQAHEDLGSMLDTANFEIIILVGTNHEFTKSKLTNHLNVKVFPNVTEALSLILKTYAANDFIFIKGSNGNNLLHIVRSIMQQ